MAKLAMAILAMAILAMATLTMTTLTAARLELLLCTADLAPAHAQLLRRRLRRAPRRLRRIACRLLHHRKLPRHPLRLRLRPRRPWSQLHELRLRLRPRARQGCEARGVCVRRLEVGSARLELTPRLEQSEVARVE